MISLTSSKSRHYIWWLMVFAIILIPIIVYNATHNTSGVESYFPESSTFCSTFNKRQSGYSGFAELVTLLGFKLNSWEKPYRHLKEIEGTLILIDPTGTPSEYDIDQILAWVAKGNKLIYFDNFSFRFNRDLLRKLSIHITDSPTDSELTITAPAKNSLFAHVPYLKADAENRLVGGTPVISDQYGSLINCVTYGHGIVLVGVTPELCSNENLTQKDHWPNFQLLINYLRTANGAIWFDERCHGFTGGNSIYSYLVASPFGLVFAQFLIIFAVALLSHNQRFGQAYDLCTQRKISSLEYVNGMASTYQKARASSLVWEILLRTYQSKISHWLNIPPQEVNAKLLDCLKDSTGNNFNQLKNLLPLEPAKPPVANNDDLLKIVPACDKIAKRLHKLSVERGKF